MRQRCPPECSWRSSVLSTWSLPQSHWMRRLSGKARLERTRNGCSCASRVSGAARMSASPRAASAASLGSCRVDRRAAGARARLICVVNASRSGLIASSRREYEGTKSRSAAGTSSGVTSASAIACSLATASVTSMERRSPCPYKGVRWQRRVFRYAMCVRTPLRHCSRRSCCASTNERNGESAGMIGSRPAAAAAAAAAIALSPATSAPPSPRLAETSTMYWARVCRA